MLDNDKKRKLILGLLICVAINIILFTYIFSLKSKRDKLKNIIVCSDYNYSISDIPGYPIEFNIDSDIESIGINYTNGEIIRLNNRNSEVLDNNITINNSEKLYFKINKESIITIDVKFKNKNIFKYEVSFNQDRNSNYYCEVKKTNA